MNRDRAAKLILMLSSDNDGEVMNAVRMLRAVGIHEIAELVRHGEQAPPSQPHIYASGSSSRMTRSQADALRYRNECDAIIEIFLKTFPELEKDYLDRRSIIRFLKKLSFDQVSDAIDITASRVKGRAAFPYFCGVCWSRIREEREESAW